MFLFLSECSKLWPELYLSTDVALLVVTGLTHMVAAGCLAGACGSWFRLGCPHGTRCSYTNYMQSSKEEMRCFHMPFSEVGSGICVGALEPGWQQQEAIGSRMGFHMEQVSEPVDVVIT